MLKANESIHWTPGHIKHGRFGKWLEGLVIGRLVEIVTGEPQFLFGVVKMEMYSLLGPSKNWKNYLARRWWIYIDILLMK